MEETFNPNASAMMPANVDIRRNVRAQLKGHWTNVVLCTLVMLIIAGVCSAVSGASQDAPLLGIVGTALTLLIATPLGFGYSVALLRHMHGEPDDDLVTRPFMAFKDSGRYLGTSLLMVVYIFLWMLLFIIPGIIKGYSYAMTPYIMDEHPEFSADECIEASKKMMAGYKWKLFLLDLGFIGWLILCVLTLGILTLWVQPWMECSHVKFYDELKARQA
jgi:uncharacterized membrane protein